MPENIKCKCPLCEQQFTPEDGMTPEEHLMRGIIKAYREMQDFHRLPCPRCGHMRMKPELEENVISRYMDVYICDECGADEAVREIRNDVFPFTVWNAVNELLKCIPGVKCENYIPEKGNPYPLCNNPAGKESTICNWSAHMEDEGGYSRYDK